MEPSIGDQATPGPGPGTSGGAQAPPEVPGARYPRPAAAERTGAGPEPPGGPRAPREAPGARSPRPAAAERTGAGPPRGAISLAVRPRGAATARARPGGGPHPPRRQRGTSPGLIG